MSSSGADPRVVIDGRPLVGNRTGIGVHTAEIAGRLPFDPRPLIASHTPIENRDGIEQCRFEVNRFPFGVAWQQFALPRISGDVFWGPHGTLPVTLDKPAIVTLHDFTSITMPGRHRLKTILSFNLFIGRSLEIARRVAAVSRAIADEAIRSFAVPAQKIEIVPNGVDEFFSPGGAEGDAILFVGTLEPRKGLNDLVAAWWSLPDRPRLILCGDPGWRTRFDRPGIEVTGFVSKERLRELYRAARIFVYPSRYEGFGIPPLEAMACGAPVIATRTGAIAEYAGDAAILVEPGNLGELRDTMLRLLRDRSLRDDLRLRGPARASRYRWEASAATMADLLREAARCA
ncbi:MAG TPA: glycosyltransferase family 1 protein [Thermoanaerobaculia bacterium]|nr:glycosyltransferase family 1 protein [Thermoanaerobaculia bacterium]